MRFVIIYNTVAQVLLVSVTPNNKFQHLTVPPLTILSQLSSIFTEELPIRHIFGLTPSSAEQWWMSDLKLAWISTWLFRKKRDAKDKKIQLDHFCLQSEGSVLLYIKHVLLYIKHFMFWVTFLIEIKCYNLLLHLYTFFKNHTEFTYIKERTVNIY